MTALLAASLSVLMIFTALLSGVFGMAGGLILIGVLLAVTPLPQAMVLHAVTQMASATAGAPAVVALHRVEDRCRQHRRQPVGGRPVGRSGSTCPTGRRCCCCSASRPSSCGRSPESVPPRTLGLGQMLGGSAICMMLMLVAGVTGPLLDTQFPSRKFSVERKADHRAPRLPHSFSATAWKLKSTSAC